MTDQARTYPCRSCGGNVREEARRCPYCESPVATVRCSACFHMNVAEALHCAGCGRDLGLEPVVTDGDVRCPDCATPMRVVKEDAGLLHDCASCGGQFVEHALFRALVARCDVLDHASPRPRPAAPGAERVRYVACPVCHVLMSRKNFGEKSGVIVDICTKHGTWFDVGELPRVLAFVEAGGLARAQKRADEEKARAAAKEHEAFVAMNLAAERASAAEEYQLGNVVGEILDFLEELIVSHKER